MDEMPPKRETFTLPPELEPLAKVMEEAGINIVYGPNSVPPPEGISEEAKKAWANLPQVPLQAADPEKLAAVREFVFLAEDMAFEQLKTQYSMEDRVINGITTLWTTPPQIEARRQSDDLCARWWWGSRLAQDTAVASDGRGG